MKSSNSEGRRKLTYTTCRIRLASSAFIICLFSVVAVAQVSANSRLPKVGTVKDYPATGLMVGCGNLYFYNAQHKNPPPEAYVFLSRGDGSNAWMNLNGRDVRLRPIKSAHGKRTFRHLTYRYGNVRITIETEDFKPEGAEAAEGDHMFKMKITLRSGRSVKVVRAVGDSDC